MFCVFVLLSLPLPRSLTRGHVVSFSDSSHQQQQSGAGIVCACMRVSVCVRAVHSPLRGQGVTMEPRGHSDNPLPPPPLSQPPPSPLLALWSSPGWQPCIRQTHHRLCPPTNTHTHTHTQNTRSNSTPPPRSGPIDTALRLSSDQSFGGAALPEENPIQHSLSGWLILRVCVNVCVCVCVCVCVRVRMCVHVCVNWCMSICTCVREWGCVDIRGRIKVLMWVGRCCDISIRWKRQI